MDIISVLFYSLLFMAIYHFFYESVLAPALRHELRYKFFKTRDQLRELDSSKLSENDIKVRDLLDDRICGTVYSMSYLSVGNYFINRKHFIDDEKSNRRMAQITKLIDNTESEGLKKIEEDVYINAGNAVMINNGSWAIYLVIFAVPIALIAVFLLLSGRGIFKILNSFKKIGVSLIFSQDDFDDNINFA